MLFEKFGIHYYGPIDGHDVDLLVKTFDFLKDQDEPVILHIITEKGRGYEPAKANPMKFHGLGPYKSETGETPAGGNPTYSQIYGQQLGKFALEDKDIVAVTAAMGPGTGLVEFQKVVPERYYDVGIAEEHAALFACGHAVQGLKPFLTIYSTFFQRAYDMAVHDIGIQNLNVRLCMDRAGLSGDDGPCAIRYPRGAGTGAVPKETPELLEIGKAEVVADGTDIAIFGLGNMFEMAEETRDRLEEMGYSVALINPRWIKPLDGACYEKFARQCPVLLTFEDHVLHHGFGAAIIEHLHDAGIHTPVERIGWPDQFIEHGNVEILREKHGLTVENALAKVQKYLPAKKAEAAVAG